MPGNDTENTYDAVWEPVPMVTAAMKENGISGGEGGQRMTALAVSSDGELLIAGTDVAGMWRSENGGEKWEMVYGGFYAKGVFSVAIDPMNKNRVIAYGGAPSQEASVNTPIWQTAFISPKMEEKHGSLYSSKRVPL